MDQILTVKPTQANIILISCPRAPTVVKQTLGPSVALINDAALHIVRVVRASSICGRPLVLFACRRRDADAVFFVLPSGFASGAAAIEGGEGRQGEQKHERKGFEHFGSVGC